jgi:microcystin-dependent protein
VGNIAASTTAKLSTITKFKIVGDIDTIADVNYDGTNTQVQLEAYMSPTYITDKPDVADTTSISLNDDVLLIARPQKNSSPLLYQTTKKNFAASLSLVPIGTILPYAGPNAPPGYSFCDGSELPRGIYSELHDVIADTYGTAKINYFKLPDLRGRFALGRNNMDNSPNDTNSGGALTPDLMGNRVNDANAGAVGSYGGVEQTSLDLINLPMNTTSNGNTYSGTSITSGESTWYNSSKTIKPVTITNPFLTINYIIYHGVTA